MDEEVARHLLSELSAIRAEIRELRAGPKGLRLAWLFKRFAKAQRRERSWRLVRNLLAPLIRALGFMLATDLTEAAWGEHIERRKATPTRTGAPPMNSTLNLELRRAKQMLAWGVRKKLIPANGLEDVRPLECLTGRETRLTEEQVGDLLAVCDRLRFPHQQALTRAWVALAASTGMRFNEVRKLRRDRVGVGGVIELSKRSTKNRRERIVAADGTALRAVAGVPEIVGDPRIFANARTGNLWDETSLRNWFRAAVKLAGLDVAVADGDRLLLPHDMRHTFASIAEEHGASPLAIRDALGHSSLATTERYLHRSQQEAAKAMAAVMGRRGPKRALGAPPEDTNTSEGQP